MQGDNENLNLFNDYINHLVISNKLSHAYLIEVNNYEEQFKYILDFVKLILCKEKNKNISILNCDKCNICGLVDDLTYQDLKIIEPDGSSIKKKQILDLQSEFKNKSLLNNKKIYIIKEAEKLNSVAANALLKFLEEPEDNIVAILLTNNRYSVIETIISRCQILSIKSDFDSIIYNDNIHNLLNFISNSNDLFVNYQFILNNILPDKETAKEILKSIEEIMLLYLRSSGNADFFSIHNIKLDFSIENIVRLILIIEEEVKKLDFNVNYKLWLDSLFSKIIGGCYE